MSYKIDFQSWSETIILLVKITLQKCTKYDFLSAQAGTHDRMSGMNTFLDFEKPIAELEGKIKELHHLSGSDQLNIVDEG